MPYTMDKFIQEAEKRAVLRASLEVRLEGIPNEQLLQRIPNEERLEGIPPEQLIDRLIQQMTPEALEMLQRRIEQQKSSRP